MTKLSFGLLQHEVSWLVGLSHPLATEYDSDHFALAGCEPVVPWDVGIIRGSSASKDFEILMIPFLNYLCFIVFYEKTKKDITRKSAAESFFWFQRPLVPPRPVRRWKVKHLPMVLRRHQVRLRLETLDGGCRLSLRVLGKPRTSNNILTTLHIVIAVKQRKMHGLWQAIYFDSLFSRYVQDVHFIASLDLDCWGQKVLKKPWRWSCSWAKDGERKLSGPNEAFGHTQRRAIHSCDSRTVDSSSIVEDFGTAQVLAWSKVMKDVDMLSQAWMQIP